MSRANVTVLTTHTVKPAGPQAHEGPLYMTAWDRIYDVLHARTIHLYKPNESQEWSAMVDTLKSSLGLALAQFSPFAGRLRWADGDRHRLEIVCNGEGAQVVEAECDREMSYFRDHMNLEKMTVLVPAVDYERPVGEVPNLLVQLTRFRCGGVALGTSTAHSVADGQAAFHFFTEWARLARGEPMKEAPYFYRTIFKKRERRNNGRQLAYKYQNPPLMLGKQDGVEEWKKETVKFALPLTKAQVDNLKKAASSSVNNNGEGESRSFSRYEVLAAHIWRCACKARGHEYEQPTVISIPVNVRNRIHTIPIPPTYFGNTIVPIGPMSHAGELISNPLGFVCQKLREAINKVDEDYIWSNFELLEKQEDLSMYLRGISVASKTPKEGKVFHGNPNMRMGSWLTLPVHGMNFGWGDKIDTIPLGRDIDGSIILLPGSDNDGSILILLCMQVAYVDRFKKHFYEDIHN